jgi:hypothetical protein
MRADYDGLPMVHKPSFWGPDMSITITVAETVPDDAFQRIVKLSLSLQRTDRNFRDVPLDVRRGPLTAVSLQVSDSDDEMRERLLLLLVADVLKTEPESQMGGLY